MISYRERIIEKLLDKYERSKSFIGANTKNQSFTMHLGKEFPVYSDDSKIDEIKAIDDAINELASEGILTCKYGKNGLLYAVTLNTDKIDQCYRILKRKPKSDLNRDLISIYQKYRNGSQILETFCAKQLERIELNKNPQHYYGDIRELENVLIALQAIEGVEQETFERDFSVRVLGDSKAFEKIRGTVISILYEYGDFPEKGTVLEDMNIVKNPGHVFFKGAGIISVSGQVLDLGALAGDISISSVMLRDIDRITVSGNSVITIENLTTFNTYVPQDEFVIYLGGYHNTARREFIKNLYDQNPVKKYYHYGDIDAGGFYILLHLREKTGIHFEPLHMDVKTLMNKKEFTKKLTENDEKRLKSLLGGEFDEVIIYMLEHDCKLEQEALDN